MFQPARASQLYAREKAVYAEEEREGGRGHTKSNTLADKEAVLERHEGEVDERGRPEHHQRLGVHRQEGHLELGSDFLGRLALEDAVCGPEH